MSSSQTPFTLTIFVAEGDPDGLQLVERSNWNGKASAVVLGRSSNGRKDWRDASGRTLSELEESQARG